MRLAKQSPLSSAEVGIGLGTPSARNVCDRPKWRHDQSYLPLGVELLDLAGLLTTEDHMMRLLG